MTPERKLLALEAVTVLLIAGLALWSVRPLLEEWGTLVAFDQRGPFWPWQDSLSDWALRPLHLAGSLLQWAVGGGTVIGVPVVALLLMIARYGVIRWAVTPLLGPVDRWIVATFGALLFAWPAVWLARFIPAQFASVFFFAALGFSLRLGRRRSLVLLVAGSLSGFVGLLFYQALAIAMVPAAALCAALAWRAVQPGERLRCAIRSGAPFPLALAAYAVYAVVVSNLGFGGYETRMLGEPISLAFLVSRVIAVYTSAFGGNLLTAPLLVSVAIGFLFVTSRSVDVRGGRFLLAMSAVLLLPVLSLIYLHMGHATDLDRTLFPASVGFVLVLIGIGGAGTGGPVRARTIAPGASLVTVALLASLAFAHQARIYWNIQSSVIEQILKKNLGAAEGVLIKDTSGLLGNLYTFYTVRGPDGINRTILKQALQFHGVDTNVGLCTPSGTDRRDPISWRNPLLATERCEDLEYLPPHDTVLIARGGPKDIVLSLEPTRRVYRGRPVRFDSSGEGDGFIVDGWSGQEANHRWSVGPTAALAVELVDAGGAAAELALGFAPFLGGGLTAQNVVVEINGVKLGSWRVDRLADYAVVIPAEVLGDGHLAIELAISDPTAPCAVSESGDCRELGVALRSLVIN